MDSYKIVITDYYYEDQEEERKAYAKLGENVEILDLTKVRKGDCLNRKKSYPL